MSFSFFIHYGLHFIAPFFISYYLLKDKWLRVYTIFILSMLVDLDHLLANPIFDQNRCSINFHPLHSYYAICIYLMMLFFKKTRIIGIALLFHMITDAIDCWI